MGQVLTRLSWDYVVVVYEDTAYGREGFNALRPVLAKAGICLTAAIMADPADTSASTITDLLTQVRVRFDIQACYFPAISQVSVFKCLRGQ